jgi:small GTP-binding protein
MSEKSAIKCKIILVGESGVGKTCIIYRFVENKFQPNVYTTVTASFSKKCQKFNDKLIEINLWDTMGTEKYRSFTKLYYINTDIAILVYDITDRKSFEEIKNFWYKEIKNNLPENIDKFKFFK